MVLLEDTNFFPLNSWGISIESAVTPSEEKKKSRNSTLNFGFSFSCVFAYFSTSPFSLKSTALSVPAASTKVTL